MNKATRNYYVDIAIGAAFLVSAISALAFLVPLGWIDFTVSTTPTILGLDFGIWQTLHKWGGIALLIGVVLHLVLHVKWIISMTANTLLKRRSQKSEASKAPATDAV